MKIQCDVCEKAPAAVICCADEAALCTKCDVEVHAANKLASKHQRLILQCLSNKLPRCDICQEKTAFIFCVEDRALFCKDCDEPIHSNSLSASHQRFLATGIRVGLSSSCNKKESNKTNTEPKPPKSSPQQIGFKTMTQNVSTIASPPWAVDELLRFSDYESSDKQKEQQQVGFNELEWLSDISVFGEEGLAAAEVPQLPAVPQNSNSTKFYAATHKKPRMEVPAGEDEEYFTVPDLG